MNTIHASTLVAAWTVRSLAGSVASPGEIARRQCPGAVLLVDLVGFTPMAVALVQEHGRDAGFALSRVLDETLGAFVDAITEHGGEVSSFAGDALMAFWPAEAPAITEDLCLLRACACAEALLGVASERARSSVTPVAAHIGVAAGECSVARLGRPGGRLLFVLAGAAVREVAQAAGLARTGEIVLAPSAASRLAAITGARLGEARSDGSRRLEALGELVPRPVAERPANGELDELARPYLHPALAARIDAGFGELMAEMRVATVLFARVGAHDDDPASLAALDATVRDLDDVVTRWGGVLDSVEIGDKGTVLVAVFGVFMGGREVGPPQALRCALEIASRDPNWGVGVATGRIFCGIIGGRVRKTWAQVGSTMALAARLMQVGAGVHCDDASAEGAEGAVEFDAAAERALKGFQQPVRTHHASRARLSLGPIGRSSETVIAGRAVEAMRIEAALDAALAGHNRVLAIIGEAGIGKSTLAAFARRQAAAVGLRAVSAVGDPVARAVPYAAWRAVVEGLLGLDPAMEEPERTERATGALKELDLDPAAFGALDDLCGLSLPRSSAVAPADRATESERAVAEVGAAVAARGGLLLVLEDAHWFDDASAGALAATLARAKGVLVLATLRPDAQLYPEELSRVIHGPSAQMVRLELLGLAETGEVVARQLGVPRVPDHLARWVHERTGCNPLFAHEVVRNLVAAGLIVVEDGALSSAPGAAQLADFVCPTTLQGAMNARIDRFDPRTQAVLKAAAVLGVQFRGDRLAELPSLKPFAEEVPTRLAELAADGILVPVHGGAWRFRSRVVQEVAEEILTPAARAQLHREAAQAIEAAAPGQASVAELARHWREANDLPRAITLLEEAARLADAAGAPAEAHRAFQEAASLDELLRSRGLGAADARRRTSWLLGMSEAAVSFGDAPRQLRAATDALSSLGAPMPETPKDWMRMALRELGLHLVFRVTPAVLWRERRDPQRLVDLARAYGHVGDAYSFLQVGDPRSWLATAVANLNRAERAGRPELGTAGWATFGLLTNLLGLRRVARWYARRGLEAAERSGEPRSLAVALVVMGHVSTSQGDWELGDATARRIVEVWRNGRAAARAGPGMTWVLHAALLRGRLAEAEEHATDMRALGDRFAVPRTLALADYYRGCVASLRGDAAAALPDLRSAWQGLVACQDGMRHYARGSLAQALARAGQHDAALAEARGLLADLGHMTITHYNRVEAPAGPAETFVLLRRAGVAIADDELRASVAPMRTFGPRFLVTSPRRYLVEGMVEAACGEPGRAVRHLERARREADALHITDYAVRSRIELARVTPEGPRRAGLLDEADALLRGRGLGLYEREIAALRTPGETR